MTKPSKCSKFGKGQKSNVLRCEIRAARLKVVLDQELGRPTEVHVKRLSAMDLPRLVRRRDQDDSAADHRTCDSTNQDPQPPSV